MALGELNDSGQTEWVTLTGQGGETLVDVALLPGTSTSELIHVHEGSCDTLGGVVYGLTNIDSDGR